MPEFKLSCPNCKKSLQIKVAAQQGSLKLRCPQCQREFKFNVPSASAPAAQAQKPPQNDPFANLNDPAFLPSGNTTAPKYATPSTVKRKSSVPSRSLWLVGGGVAGVLVLVTVAFTVWKLMPSGGLPNLTGSEVATEEAPLEAPLPSLPWGKENVQDLEAELFSLRDKTQASASALSEPELATTGVMQLNDARKQFQDIFYRIVNATPRSLDLKKADELERSSHPPAGGAAPAVPSNYVWTLTGGVDPLDPWKTATHEVSRARREAEWALTSRAQYPDPLKETSGLYNWSTEDRRVLSAYWLQAELERDVATELLACMREKVSMAKLQDRCGTVIDGYVAPAIELAKVISAQGTLMIKVPSNTIYERHAVSTRSVLEQLKERHPHPALGAIIKETIDISEAIADLKFQRGGRLLDYAKTTTRERLAAIREAEQKQKLAAEEQSRQQEMKLAEELAAKKDAEEKERQRQASDLAQRQQENQLQNHQAQGSASGSNAPSSVPPVPNGQPIGMSGGPFGPGRGGSIPQNSSFPQAPLPPSMAASPFGPVPRETSSAGNGPAGAGQASVTIRISQATDGQVQQAMEAIKAISSDYQTSNSNGKVELKIFKYTGTLADLATKLPMLKFDKMDDSTRTVDATFR